MTEQNRARTMIWNGLMAVPHRKYADLVGPFREAWEDDPDFVARTCVYLRNQSKIRDQVDVGIITLLQCPADFWDHREAGRCLLAGSDVYDMGPESYRTLPPYRVLRIADYVRHSDRRSSRMMRDVMGGWFESLMSNPDRFDGAVLLNRKALKVACQLYHVKLTARAKAILLDNDPPEGSKPWVVREIARSSDLTEQVSLVMEHGIPYTVANSILPKGPATGIALVSVMTPTQALNSRSWVESSGLLDIPEVKTLYLEKVSQATRSVASADHRRSAQGTDADVQEAISQAKEQAVAKTERIARPTLILVDKSGSMRNCIEIAQEFGSRIAPLCDDLEVYAFDDMSRHVKVTGTTLRDWEMAFRAIRPGGSTSAGAGLADALRDGFVPQEIVVITDEEENRRPYLIEVMSRMDSPPHVSIISVNGNGQLTRQLETQGFRVDSFPWTGDYYVYDQVSALLGGAAAKSLVEKILETELPRRTR